MTMPYEHEDGFHPVDPGHQTALDQQGYLKCKNHLCDFMISPEVQDGLEHQGGSRALYDCPHCGHTQQPLLSPAAGGSTATGMVPSEQGQIGENLVREMGQLPGYGKILWWHGTDASEASPIDGIVPGWAVEVKTTSVNTQRVRGNIAPRDKPSKVRVINNFDAFASERSDPELTQIVDQIGDINGLLGVLVVLDVETNLASVWAHEMPKDTSTGVMGPAHIKHPTRKVLLADNVPFTHALPDPRQPGWVPHHQQQQAPNDSPF